MPVDGYTQYEFYSSSGDSNLVLMQSNTCSSIDLGKYKSFIDIAITPNGTLYGVDDSLYLIDVNNETTQNIGSIITSEGVYVWGNGLVALNNDYLLADHSDSLVKISVVDATAENIGFIGYWSNGDFAFFNKKLYLADGLNHLIEIVLDPLTDNVISVTDIGLMNTFYGSVYSLFTSTSLISCEGDRLDLYAIDGDKVYKLDVTDANATEICFIPNEHYSYGAASTYDFEKVVKEKEVKELPNVFSPNNDGSNDLFEIPQSFSSTIIFNRWGEKVFDADSDGVYWDGKTTSGSDVPEGTYFYIISLKDDCSGDEKIVKGTLSLLR